MSRTSFVGALAAALLLCGTGAQAADKSHGLSAFGDLKYGADFKHFDYVNPDAPKGAKQWWLVSEDGEVDLCYSDHGYDIDILINCSLKVMTKIWICEQSFNDAVKVGDITIKGEPKLVNRLQDWLRSSPLSRLGTLETLPKLDWVQN